MLINRKLKILTGLLFILILAPVVKAQDDTPPDINVPASAASAEKFVPRGWRIETEDDDKLTGDLNGDGKVDRLLRLVEDKPLTAPDDTPNTRYRALVILLAKDGGGFNRAAVTTRLLFCSTCAGMLGDPASGGNIQIKIQRNVIIVSQQSGSRFAYEQTLRFRFDPATSRFLMIGEDFDNRDRAEGTTVKESTNYLTGLKIISKYRLTKDGGDEKLISKVETKITRPKKFIEDIDYSK
ncbi:MAG TPA: hypothetical protein VJX74_17015 [Blastocatellia bacterium]|nr:hypothetical protein [Blastocatellia bacterium]